MIHYLDGILLEILKMPEVHLLELSLLFYYIYFLLENKIFRPFLRIGIDDCFCFESGERDWMRSQYNLNANQIAKRVSIWLSNNE